MGNTIKFGNHPKKIAETTDVYGGNSSHHKRLSKILKRSHIKAKIDSLDNRPTKPVSSKSIR